MKRLRLGGGRGSVGVLLGTTVGVVEHGVTSPDLYVHTVAHGDRLEHLHHLLVGHSQHTDVIDVDQDVR